MTLAWHLKHYKLILAGATQDNFFVQCDRVYIVAYAETLKQKLCSLIIPSINSFQKLFWSLTFEKSPIYRDFLKDQFVFCKSARFIRKYVIHSA